MIKILGIDPGSQITGVGVIEVVNNKSTFVDAKSLILKGEDMTERLRSLHEQLCQYIQHHKPNVVVLEEVFSNPRNLAASLKLAQARGVALACVIAQHNVIPIPMFEYAARLVKKTITGVGSADKVQVQHMIKLLLSVNHSLPVDACDALAIALCHATFNNSLGGKPLAKKKTKRSSWRLYDCSNQGKTTR